MRVVLIALSLAPAPIAHARPTRLALCHSGKTGRIELFVRRRDDTFILTSNDMTKGKSERVFGGEVVRATHRNLDERHHEYVFELHDGLLQQASGLDEKRCQSAGERASCRIDALRIKLARHGPRHPGDDGIVPLQDGHAVQMDNGGPQNCTVYASKALRELLGRGPRGR